MPRKVWVPLVVALLLVAVLGGSALQRPEPGPLMSHPRIRTAVFLGDSYTEGVPGASAPSKRFSALFARAQGWREVNLGHGGTGYLPTVPPIGISYTEMIDEAAAANPDVVVVSGGRNDLEIMDAAWAAGVRSFYSSLRAAVGPDTQIIATSPVWSTDTPPMLLLAACTVVQRAVTAVGGTYVDLGDPLLGKSAYMAADQIHPNDAGHAAIAEAFAAAYTRTDAATFPRPVATPVQVTTW